MAKITLRDKIYLSGLEPEEIKLIKEQLTLPNPKYAAAKKYSRYSRINIPPFLTYYTDYRNGDMTVPIGFDVSEYAYIESVEDNRIKNEVTYPEFQLELRGDQQEAADNYLWLNQREHIPQGIATLPTGKGKTVLGLYLAHALHQRTLVIVHKDDLILAWQKDIDLCFSGQIKPGLIKAKSKKIGAHLTLATIQTLNRMSKGDLEVLFSAFGLVICDEGHHISANTYTMFGNFNSMYKLLLTATPERADGLTKVMFFYAGDFAFKYENRENEKDILPVEVFIRESAIEYTPVITLDGKIENLWETALKADDDFTYLTDIPYEQRPKIDYHALEDYTTTMPCFIEQVVKDILSEAKKNRSCIVFISQKEHCDIYYERLKNPLGDKVQLYYGDSKESNEVILSRAESKECLVTIATYAKGTEGTNCKSWEVAFLVSSLNNGKNVEQAIGRIRRVKEGKLKTARVYDYRHPHVYILKNHGATRDARYQKLGFKIHGGAKNNIRQKTSRFTKGFKQRG